MLTGALPAPHPETSSSNPPINTNPAREKSDRKIKCDSQKKFRDPRQAKTENEA
jgi:hypothetical protein